MTRPAPMLRLLATVASLALIVSAAAAQTKRFPGDSVVQAILNEQVTAKKTAGIVVGLLDADGTRRVLSAGKSDNKGLLLDGNSVFEIGSITKPFTASLLADMVARGDVKLSDRVRSFLPASVTIPSRNGREITLLDLRPRTGRGPGFIDLHQHVQDPAGYQTEALDGLRRLRHLRHRQRRAVVPRPDLSSQVGRDRHDPRLVGGIAGMSGTYLGGFLGDRFGARDARWYLRVPAIA